MKKFVKYNDRRETIKFLVSIILPNKKIYIFIGILMCVTTGIITVSAYVYKLLIDNITEKDQVLRNIGLYVFANIVMYAVKMLMSYMNKINSNLVEIGLCRKILIKMLDLDGSEIEKYDSSELMTILYNDALKIAEWISNDFFSCIFSIIKAIGMLIFLLYIRWELLILIVIIQPITSIVQKRMRKSNVTVSEEYRTNLGKLMSVVKECTSYLTQIISLGIGDYIYQKFNLILENQKKSETKINMITVINDSILGILFIVPECIIILVGSMEISERTLSLGGLLLFIQYSGELFLPFTVIYETSFEFSSVVPAINRVKDFLENTNEKRCILRNSDSIVGKIDIKDMKFSYDQQEILSGINMSFEPGIVYALYGESGSGKSTICKILLKLWRINRKSVFLDGHDINEYDKYLLRKNITYISQDIILLDDTIYNNIVLDRKYISNKRFNEVVIKVGLKEFIEQLPYKEHTRLENQGEKISGGQKQRIALARAIVRESAVIILDEPTSALDSQNGEKIIDNMIKEFTKSTFIIISHADSIIEKCDIVYKIKDRKVIQVKK